MGIARDDRGIYKLIRFEDGLMVEVEAEHVGPIRKGSRYVERVSAPCMKVEPVIDGVLESINRAQHVDDEGGIDPGYQTMELEFGIAIDSEGEPYLARQDSSSVNINVRIKYTRV
jgi:hypothetical protein